MDYHYPPHPPPPPREEMRDLHRSQTSESSSSSSSSSSGSTVHESKAERAARIRQNQRRCRERKLAYVSSLEERLRAYESNGVQANVHLQKLSKKLDAENRKLKKILHDVCGITDFEMERSDADVLIEEVKARLGAQGSGTSGGVKRPLSTASRSSSFSGGVLEMGSWSAWSDTSAGFPFSTCAYPSAPLSDIRSQKPPTPPPTKEDAAQIGANGPYDLLLSMAPQTDAKPYCGDDLSSSGKRFCGLLQLLALESHQFEVTARDSSAKTVPCRVSYELLKSLIDEQDSVGMQNAGFELKRGLHMTKDGCSVDAKVLSSVLDRLVNHHGNVNGAATAANAGMMVDV